MPGILHASFFFTVIFFKISFREYQTVWVFCLACYVSSRFAKNWSRERSKIFNHTFQGELFRLFMPSMELCEAYSNHTVLT